MTGNDQRYTYTSRVTASVADLSIPAILSGIYMASRLYYREEGTMYKKILLAVILLFPALVSAIHAEENRYYVAERDLQRIYEHFEGISLEKAIDQLLMEKCGGPKGFGNVKIQFNGGGMNDRLFIGRENTLEILVETPEPVRGTSLAFEFTCSAGSGAYQWLELPDSNIYERITPINSPISYALAVHNDVFNGCTTWYTYSTSYSSLDTIYIGGINFGNCDIPTHSSPVVLYSMRLWLDYDTSFIGEQFIIDNIIIDSTKDWNFTDAATATTNAPDYQGFSNTSHLIPDAPDVSFAIAEPRCEHAGKSTNPNIVYFETGQVVPVEKPLDFDFIPVFQDGKGNKILCADIIYEGSYEDLEELGVEIDSFRPAGSLLMVEFPLSILPQVCQVGGVKKILLQDVGTFYLNYSTVDVTCDHQKLKDSLDASGDSVIIGIIDSGVDWLHEDFIDSNDITKIK
jgi:hypothetical protein